MEIKLSNRRQLLDRDEQVYAMRLFSSALDRMRGVIHTVSIGVADENGPRGGIDKTCSVQIKLIGGSSLILKEKAASFNQALAISAEKAKENLSRWHGKRKTLTRKKDKIMDYQGNLSFESIES
jgi:hypothetical protein